MILVGTSGYSYEDWKGRFYPPGMRSSDFLEFYSRHFEACEINFTYYRMPNAGIFERMLAKSGRRVIFTVKAHQDMTHTREAGADAYVAFTEALAPIADAGCLGCVLVQYPWSFENIPKNRDELRSLADRFRGIPVVVEFRNGDWVTDEVIRLLEENGLGFCCVDEPRLRGLMPPVAVATSEVGYVRFHGRNRAKWWKHDRPEERYDYLYTRDELAEWVPLIRQIENRTSKTFVFTNNHFEAKAVTNAEMLLDLLGIKSHRR